MSKILHDYIAHEINLISGVNEEFEWIPVGGGSINQCYKLKGKRTHLFVKLNKKTVFKNGFLEEKRGLQFLRGHGIQVPEIVLEGSEGQEIFLVLKWVATGNKSSQFWENLADQLASLHRKTNPFFGLDHTNYMGQLTQINKPEARFTDFFIKNRLQPQVKYAYDNRLLNKELLLPFDKLYAELPSLFPLEEPSAVHGDLWSGNYICNSSSTAIFIDPAVYYGHREVDLAMSLLFGGFSQEFYQYYQDFYPLEPGFSHRSDLYNLYPLLIHLNLFGLGYLGQIKGIVSRF